MVESFLQLVKIAREKVDPKCCKNCANLTDFQDTLRAGISHEEEKEGSGFDTEPETSGGVKEPQMSRVHTPEPPMENTTIKGKEQAPPCVQVLFPDVSMAKSARCINVSILAKRTKIIFL